jgi:hypothetical protein
MAEVDFNVKNKKPTLRPRLRTAGTKGRQSKI